MQEFIADAAVRADRRCDPLNAGTDSLPNVRPLVDEGDLHSKKSVCSIFRKLGRFAADEDDRCFTEGKRSVDALHNLTPARTVVTNKNSIRMDEVLDGGALAQKFWI